MGEKREGRAVEWKEGGRDEERAVELEGGREEE